MAFSWGVQTVSTCWRGGGSGEFSGWWSNLTSNWSSFAIVASTFSSFVVSFSQFSKASITLHNVLLLMVVLSPGNRWTKDLAISKYGSQNLASWCLRLWSLWMGFACYCSLSWLPIWLRSKWWIHISSIVTYRRKTPVYGVETVTNNALHRPRVVLFDRLWDIATPTLNTALSLTMFIQNGELATFWYLQLFCYLTQLHLTILWTYLMSTTTTYRIWATRAFSIICICAPGCKVKTPPLERCFRRSRTRITLITLLDFSDALFHLNHCKL